MESQSQSAPESPGSGPSGASSAAARSPVGGVRPSGGAVGDALLAVALLAVFAPALAEMAGVWSRVDYASHGFLVPLVALWAATAQRARLARLPAAPSALGLAALAAALGLYGLGVGIGQVGLQGLAFVAAVAAGVLARRGAAWLRTLAFPIAYLLFMVPIPEAWLAPLIVRLQLFVSAVGVGLLRLGGVDVARDGNVIQLPGGESLFVAEACSGITSVVTLVPIAVFLAYFTERTFARRCVLVAAVVPLAMLGNLARVMATVLVARRYGAAEAASGFFHESAGLLTYVLGCAALLAIGAAMGRLWPEDRTTRAAPPAP